MVELDNFYPTIVVDCFNIFVGCTRVIGDTLVITQGLEQLATTSATCFLHTFSHLLGTDPRSSIIKDIHHRYKRVFQEQLCIYNIPSSITFQTIHVAFYPYWDCLWDFGLSNHEHIISSCAQVKIVQFMYQRNVLPPWTLGFVLHSLFLDPLPPTSVIINCLSILAIALE